MKLLQFILFIGLLTSSLHAGVGREIERASHDAARRHMQSPVIFFEAADSRLVGLESTVKMSPNPFKTLQELDAERKKAYREACHKYAELLRKSKEVANTIAPEHFLKQLAWYFETELKILMNQRELNSPDSPYGMQLLELHQRLAELPKFVKKAPEGTIKPLARRRK